MPPAERGRSRGIVVGDRLDQFGVGGLIGVVAELLAEPEHGHHRLAQPGSEAVEQLEQDRVVRGLDDAAVEGGVGPDMVVDLRSVSRPPAQRAADGAQFAPGVRRSAANADASLSMAIRASITAAISLRRSTVSQSSGTSSAVT